MLPYFLNSPTLNIASHPRNIIAWISILRQTALLSDTVSKLNTLMGQRQLF